MILHESAEMYLETIYVLSKKQSLVRSVDIAQEMGYSKPTISEWMGKLGREGYLTIETGGNVVLTEKGLEIASKIYERHTALEKLFKNLGVDPEIAAEDACRIEHYISDETFEALRRCGEQYCKEHPGCEQ